MPFASGGLLAEFCIAIAGRRVPKAQIQSSTINVRFAAKSYWRLYRRNIPATPIGRLPRSTFYYQQKVLHLADKDIDLKAKIRAVFERHKGRYGEESARQKRDEVVEA